METLQQHLNSVDNWIDATTILIDDFHEAAAELEEFDKTPIEDDGESESGKNVERVKMVEKVNEITEKIAVSFNIIYLFIFSYIIHS